MNSYGGGASDAKERVLCLAGWWPEGGSANGIFIREHLLAIARQRPVDVVYTVVEKWSRPWTAADVCSTQENGLLLHRIRIRTPLRRFGFPARLVRRAYKRLLERIERPALMHIHVLTDETAQATPLARAMGIPVVVTEHNSFYHLGIRALPTIEQVSKGKAIRRWFDDPNIAKVMPVSNDLARVLVDDYKVPAEKIKVIPNVAADVFHPANGPSGEPFRMLLAAVWRPPKDHDVFISALRELPAELRSKLVVDWAGYGPDMARIKLRCATELPDLDVRFPGALTKAELAHSMQVTDLFVLPTKADNLPCVVLESHCCGTPVVSMRVNGVPELIDATNGLLVPPSDPTALAEALAQCIRGDVRFDRAAIARTALMHYAPDVVGARIERVYCEVLNEGTTHA